MAFIEPHSGEWFSIVNRVDPFLGSAVRATIACEHSREICTFCGFPAIGDFHVVEPVATRRGVPSLRLCDCCHATRAACGETLTPMIDRPARKSGAIDCDQRGIIGFWKRVYRALL
jgi:hypothetical protein